MSGAHDPAGQTLTGCRSDQAPTSRALTGCGSAGRALTGCGSAGRDLTGCGSAGRDLIGRGGAGDVGYLTCPQSSHLLRSDVIPRIQDGEAQRSLQEQTDFSPNCGVRVGSVDQSPEV